jgi:hypothetical protein
MIADTGGKQVYAETVIGKDTFWAQPNSSYSLKVSALQKKPVESSFSVGGQSATLVIRLQPTGNELKSVVVVARKPLVRLEDDKEIIDAEPLANASTNAYEVLEKTPGAVVLDGSVYINSSTPAVIQINGRELKLKGEDITALLKSLPANAIVRVEVLRTPSAKYDASSSGGIINVVLKKGVRLGTSGSVNISSFQGRRNTTSFGASVNKSEGSNTSYLGYQFSNRNGLLDLQTDRASSPNVGILQQSHTDQSAQNHNLRGGIDHQINPNASIGYDGMMSYNRIDNTAANTNTILGLPNRNELGRVVSGSNNRNNNIYLSNVISSRWKLDSLGSSWDNVAEYKLYADDGSQQYSNTLPSTGGATHGDGDLKNQNHLVTLQSDYTRQLGKTFKIETGVRADWSIGKNRADFMIDTNGDGYKPNLYQTNYFDFQQRVLAGYAQVSRTIYGFNIKPGVRLEATHMNGQQLYPGTSDFTIDRTDVFPFLYIRHNLWKMFKTPLIATASYRKSIQRPGFDMLNPAPQYIDQFLFDRGNPALLPQLTYKYELNVAFNDFPVFAIGVRDNQNLFTNVSYQDPTTGVAFRTYDNLGRNKELFLRLVGGIPPTIGKYFFFVSAEYTRRQFSGEYQGSPISYERASWVLFTYHNFKPTKTLTLSTHGFWLINGFDKFYELQNFGALNFSASKTFLDSKLTVVATVNDIFRTNRQEFVLNQPGIYATGNRAEDTRRFGITLRYNFGITNKKPSMQNPLELLSGEKQ